MSPARLTPQTIVSALLFALVGAGGAVAQEHTLRIQTHHSPESVSGRLVAQFVEDVHTMSGGRVAIEMFYSASVVKSVETFDAAVTGILDGDMTNGNYQVGKNPAFQFVSDIMGGYETPWQMYEWLYHAGGYEQANELYNEYNMQLIGWWVYGQESLSSSKPLAGIDDLNGWKFRSPPGLETELFSQLGASPVVMDFTEVFTALETGIIDGADASGLANNISLGLYDLVEHATFPGFHSMPADHLAIRKDAWDALPEDIRRIFEVAMQKLAFQTAMTYDVENAKASESLPEQGVTLHDWSEEDRNAFRQTAQKSWQTWADQTPEARALVDSHIEFMNLLGLLD
jgi:TRAP-type C4-dicarboxylate transport system substrate-binding protein